MRVVFHWRHRLRGDALPGEPPPSDAVPAGARRRAPEGPVRPSLQEGALALLFAGLFVAGTVAALFGERGWFDLRESRKELEQLERDVARQLEELVRLRQDVRALARDPQRIERLAREELGLVRPGEIQFVLPSPDPLHSPPQDGGSGEHAIEIEGETGETGEPEGTQPRAE